MMYWLKYVYRQLSKCCLLDYQGSAFVLIRVCDKFSREARVISEPLLRDFFAFASESSVLPKANQNVDHKRFQKSTGLFFQGRNKQMVVFWNLYKWFCFVEFASKSSILPKVNQIIGYKCFQESTIVQGRKQKQKDILGEFASKPSFLSNVNQTVDYTTSGNPLLIL